MPKVEIVYVVVSRSERAREFAARFVVSFLTYPPVYPAKVTIACNGGEPDPETKAILQMFDCEIKPRDNDRSWDLGAYYEAARTTEADMLVCLGESVYFHRSGWLGPLAAAWDQCGPGMYGLFSSHFVRSHLNTTGFAVCPKLLLSHPKPQEGADRYEFEHGRYSFWRALDRRKVPVRFVTWDGVWEPKDWRVPQNILWRGDQSNLLAWCNHSDKFTLADARTKSVWSMNADRPFK